ncbi:Histone-lysine N-methyltransferase 2E [Armadillidium nasatum]|uniref:Histone-lysine N-methyltransferase 2E n=1 Tax=Armadillidium nasatum TaxID=96803 RepID=A0A5N5T160_9CRUS|nr:Histone-lysine N-methyltransferase 2E [Armadillidium nasatum]
MSLLVHELLIGTGGGGTSAAGLQTPPSNPVPLASVTVTHSNSTVQVAHIQQSRVVTITSSQTRPSSSEKGSRLADALAGNSPYSYSNPQQRLSRSHPTNRNASTTNSGVSVTQSESLKSLKPVVRQAYNLPFVLQDHNYGAPPPPTPPHSPPPPPPPPPISAPPTLSHSYKLQQIISPITTSTIARNQSSPLSSPTKINQYPKLVSEPSVVTFNNAGAVHVSNSNGTIASTSSSHSPTSHIISTMPLHRQQFMPQPKVNLFPSSSIPIPSNVCDTITSQTGGGQDTDEESRLSDRSSSVGPSGEETETAPEGEGEEQIQADDSITRCICNFTHDDGYMIQCDRCFVWQHVDCMEIDRNNIPDEYLCEACKPRVTDKSKARALQIRRRQEIRAHLARVSSSDSDDNANPPIRTKNSSNKSQERKVFKKKKNKTSKENKSRKHSSSKTSVLNISSDAADEKESKPPLKSRRRQNTLSGSSQSGDDSCSNYSFNIEQLRSWIEQYEIAVTNHYSPELRAKVHAARINGISAEFRESTQGALLGHRCRVAPCYNAGPDSFDQKILVAATRLQPGTAIIEYQGKYTLKSQWNTVQVPPALPYLPFVLQYNMQKEGLQICVDARTYGNDARFARRSSQSNAEIRHVVERGSVHLYIVACKEINEEEEITLPLDTAICQQLIPNKINAQLSCNKMDGNENVPKEASKLTQGSSQVRKNGILHSNRKNMRKPLLSLSLPQTLTRVSRRATSSDDIITDDSFTAQTSPVKQRRASGCTGSRSPAKCTLKSPSKSPSKAHIEDSSSGESPHHESPGEKNDNHKMTREERKIAAYIRAFEKMEKAAQRRQEMEKKKVEDKGRKSFSHDDDDDDKSKISDIDGRKGKKPLTKGSPIKTSGSDLLEEENYVSSEGEKSKQPDGVTPTYGSPPSSGFNNLGFRFPKTKKALMNEWLNETVDPVLHSPSLGDVTTGVPTCYMRSPSIVPKKGGATSLCGNSGFIGNSELAGRSAKKRWLRQAIIDETEPQGVSFPICSSPSSRPDSPTGGCGDYITPLKKRRLARESMSSEQSNTPPSTPLHSEIEDKYNEEMELDHASDENLYDDKLGIKCEENSSKDIEESKIKKEENVDEINKKDYSNRDDNDRLTIDISKICVDIKIEEKESVKNEIKPEVDCKNTHELPKLKVEERKDSDDDVKLRPVPNVVEEKDEIVNKTYPSAEHSDVNVDIISKPRKEKIKKQKKKPVRVKDVQPKLVVKNKTLKSKNLDKNRNMHRKKVTKSSKVTKKGNKGKTKKTDLTSSKNMNGNVISDEISKDNKNLGKCEDAKDETLQSLTSCDDGKEECNIEAQLEEPINTSITKVEEPTTQDSLSATMAPDSSVKLQEIEDPENSFNSCQKNITLENNKILSEEKFPNSFSCEEKSVEKRDSPSCVDDSSKEMENPSSCTDDNHYPQSPTPIKPAPVKKKLSILEYRKRKSTSYDKDYKEDPLSSEINVQSNLFETTFNSRETLGTVQVTEISRNVLPSRTETRSPSTDSQFSKLSMSSLGNLKSEKADNEATDAKDIKWNAAPTLLEQQRENLTARLRREFGLGLPEDHQLKLKLGDNSNKEKWAELEKKYQFGAKKFLPLPPLPPSSSSSSSYMLVPTITSQTVSSPTNKPFLGQLPSPPLPLTSVIKGLNFKINTPPFYSGELKPSIPLPSTFEKLNDVRICSSDSGSKSVFEDTGQSSLFSNKFEKQKNTHSVTQCESEKNNTS